MKKNESHTYDCLIEKIDNLEKTIGELTAKLHSMTLLWHNNTQKPQMKAANSPPTKEEK